jgi:hypothetical protein
MEDERQLALGDGDGREWNVPLANRYPEWVPRVPTGYWLGSKDPIRGKGPSLGKAEPLIGGVG